MWVRPLVPGGSPSPSQRRSGSHEPAPATRVMHAKRHPLSHARHRTPSPDTGTRSRLGSRRGWFQGGQACFKMTALFSSSSCCLSSHSHPKQFKGGFRAPKRGQAAGHSNPVWRACWWLDWGLCSFSFANERSRYMHRCDRPSIVAYQTPPNCVVSKKTTRFP